MNDQPPVFSQGVYNASVAENRDPGEPVTRVAATDEDSGKKKKNCFSQIITMEQIEKKNSFSSKIVFVFDIIIHERKAVLKMFISGS